MAMPFCSTAGKRKEVSELLGYFMRHVTGVDVGFSWDEHDPHYPADEWERIPAVAASLGNLREHLDFEMRVMHEFLQWNRAQPNRVVLITKEYAVARKVLELAGLAGIYGPNGLVAKVGLLDEARRAISSLIDAIRGVKYVESTRTFGQQVLAKLEAANPPADEDAPPSAAEDTSEGADARLICKVAREAGTPVSVQTARAILVALASQATHAKSAAPHSKED